MLSEMLHKIEDSHVSTNDIATAIILSLPINLEAALGHHMCMYLYAKF